MHLPYLPCVPLIETEASVDISRRAFLVGKRPVAAVPEQAECHVVAFGESCLAHRQVVCRTCSESCGEGAIRFPLVAGGVAQPTLDAARCTGCAECLVDCPTQAIRLIPVESVLPSPVQQGAA